MWCAKTPCGLLATALAPRTLLGSVARQPWRPVYTPQHRHTPPPHVWGRVGSTRGLSGLAHARAAKKTQPQPRGAEQAQTSAGGDGVGLLGTVDGHEVVLKLHELVHGGKAGLAHYHAAVGLAAWPHGYSRVMDMLVANKQPPPTRQTLGLAVGRCVAARDTDRAWATLEQFNRHYGLQGDMPVYSQLLATYGGNAEAAVCDAQRHDLHGQLPFMAAAASCLLSGQLQVPVGYTDNVLQWLVDRVGGTVGPEHSSTVLGSVAVHHARQANLSMLALVLHTANEQNMPLPPSALLAAVRAYGQAGKIETMQEVAAAPALQHEEWAGPVANALLGGLALAGNEAAVMGQLENMRTHGLGISRRTQAALASMMCTATPGLVSAVADTVTMHRERVTARMWAALVEGYGRHGMTADVERVLGSMEDAGGASDQAYRYAMVACAKAGHGQGLRGIYGRMYVHSVTASQATHYTAMRCHLALRDWEGLSLHLATLARMNLRVNPQTLGRALASSPDLGGALQGLSPVLKGQGIDIVGTAMCSVVQQGGTDADVWRVVGALTAQGMLQAPRPKDWAKVVGVLVGQGKYDVTMRLLADLRDKGMLFTAVLQPALLGLGRNRGPEVCALWTMAGQAGLHGATWEPVLLRRVAYAQAQAKDAQGLMATIQAMQGTGLQPPSWASAGLVLAACSTDSIEGITTAIDLLARVPAPGPRTASIVCRALASVGQLEHAKTLFAHRQWARWVVSALSGTIQGFAEAGKQDWVVSAWEVLCKHDLARAHRGDILPVATGLSQMDMRAELVALWGQLKIAGLMQAVWVWRVAVKAHGKRNNTTAVAALYLTGAKAIGVDTIMKSGMPRPELTWGRVLFALADRNLCTPMMELLDRLQDAGLNIPGYVQYRCVEVLGQEGRLDGLLLAMQAFRGPDRRAPMYVYHALLQTCVAKGNASAAVRTLTHMCHVGPSPDHTALGLTLQAVFLHGNPRQLLVISDAMKTHGQGMDETVMSSVHKVLSTRLRTIFRQPRALEMWLEACVQSGLYVPWPIMVNLAYVICPKPDRDVHAKFLRHVVAQIQHTTPNKGPLHEGARKVLHMLFEAMGKNGDTRGMMQVLATYHSVGQPAGPRYYELLWQRLCEACKGPGHVDYMLELIREWDRTCLDWRKGRPVGLDARTDQVLLSALVLTCALRKLPETKQRRVMQLAAEAGVGEDTKGKPVS